MKTDTISLVLFTCTKREHLLKKTYSSFLEACDFKFDKILLAIDGQIDADVITFINPDLTVYHHTRRGYVNSISKALKLIDTPYFFWLEDDWLFHKRLSPGYQLNLLQNNPDWCQVLFSQWYPLPPEYKMIPVGDNLYQTPYGFSANPCLCNTAHIQSGFKLLEDSPKGSNLGEHGFENYLTKRFKNDNVKSVIIDPVDQKTISHEGYLESTPRNWHMTNSLEEKTKEHLLTIPAPSVLRKLAMLFKLLMAIFKLAVGQLFSNKIYELCFRIVSSSKTVKDE